MDGKNLFIIFFMILLNGSLIGCGKSTDAEMEHFNDLASQGKEVFESNLCYNCHVDEGAKADSMAPDLSGPFLANDSLMVQAHLKFVSRSEMPPIRLNENEIRLLSHYIAGIHRMKNPTLVEKGSGTRCPVCMASISKKKATEFGFYGTFLGKKYYFECPDCMSAFKEAPEAFLALAK